MKKVFKLFFIAACFLLACNLCNPVNSEAKSNSNHSIITTTEKADFFLFIRVLEGGRPYIYIYTDGGIFVTKIEEL